MRILTILVAGLLSCNAMAAEGEHIIGGSVGYGGNEIDGFEKDTSTSGDNVVYDIYYRYMWHDNFGIEAGYFAGSSGLASAFGSIFGQINDIEYSGFRTTLYGKYMLSERNSLYAKLGGSANKLSYEWGSSWSNDELQHSNENDIDLYAAVGWEVRFHSGFGMNIEYQYIPVQALTAQNVNFGISYQF
ncbi:porin family protein [Shewanella sp. Choline-02u-19]|uniref:porin family protein n=1 Tax=unclassified Shewanella TaxID=196818 RepID=UPI000C32C304|nr:MULTISPECIES: porin family protein [unclassified Shewanella]PKH58453.1 porin family protein [Shewanella sp. Bg11-22]PKI26526.1 porin family protein [Shewanella sp. Choline-02u-19]